MRSRQGMESRQEERGTERTTTGSRIAPTATPSSWWKERSKMIKRPRPEEQERHCREEQERSEQEILGEEFRPEEERFREEEYRPEERSEEGRGEEYISKQERRYRPEESGRYRQEEQVENYRIIKLEKRYTKGGIIWQQIKRYLESTPQGWGLNRLLML